MFGLKSFLYTVALIVPLLVFLYYYIRRKNEFGYFDVIVITGLLWVCGFVFTVNFGGIIFMIMEGIRKFIDFLMKYV